MSYETPNQLLEPDTAVQHDAAYDAGFEITEQRMEMLQQVSSELHEEWPEYVGMTVFGSMSRREARIDSDADVFVFIKPDQEASLQHDPRVADAEVIRRLGDNQVGTVAFNSFITAKYHSQAAAAIEASGIPRAGVIVLPLDSLIVTNTTSELLQNAELINLGDDTIGARVPRNIRALFHVPLQAQELAQFQKQVLDTLNANPNGELAWRMIRHMVLSFEARKDVVDVGTADHRPLAQNLGEARQQFFGELTDS